MHFVAAILILSCALLPAGAQNILGKHPADKVLMPFMQQNTNADTIARGLSNSTVALEVPVSGIRLGGSNVLSWAQIAGGLGDVTQAQLVGATNNLAEIATSTLIVSDSGAGLLDGVYVGGGNVYNPAGPASSRYLTNRSFDYAIISFGVAVETNTSLTGTYHPTVGHTALGNPLVRYGAAAAAAVAASGVKGSGTLSVGSGLTASGGSGATLVDVTISVNTNTMVAANVPATGVTGSGDVASGTTGLGVAGGTGAALRGVIITIAGLAESAISGLVADLAGKASTNLASHSAAGLFSTNDYTFLQTVPEWQAGAEIAPLRAMYPWSETEATHTNLIVASKLTGWLAKGFNIIAVDLAFYNNTTLTNGHIGINFTDFPDGTNYFTILHTNGFRSQVWFDSVHGYPGGNPTMAQYIDTIQTIISWLSDGDLFWLDVTGRDQGAWAAYIASTNKARVQIGFGIDAFNVDKKLLSLGSFFRLHGSGDVVNWARVKEYADIVETNINQYVKPGRHFILGPEANSLADATEQQTITVLQAFWSAMEVDLNRSPIGANTGILEIQGDPAAVCARRVLVTNGCWVYLKPLITARGPNFALGIVNTNDAVTDITFNFNALAYGRQQSSIFLTSPTYSVMNLSNSVFVGQSLTNFTLTNFTSHGIVWYKLFPGAAVTTNILPPSSYSPTLMPVVINSNGVVFTDFANWDSDVTNLVSRGQLGSQPNQVYALQYLATALKAAGFWDRMSVIYPVPPGAPFLNFKSTSFTLNTNALGLVTNTMGISGSGTTAFTNGFNLLTSDPALVTSNSFSMGVYSGTNIVADGSYIAGAINTAQDYLLRSGSSLCAVINETAPSCASANNSGAFSGLLAAGRVSSTKRSYNNGIVALGSTGILTLPSAEIAFAGLNTAGTLSGYSDVQIQFAWIGNGFSGIELNRLKPIIDRYESLIRPQ